jgi:hypothetical protein
MYQGIKAMIIFAPGTYAYLGDNVRFPDAQLNYAAALITMRIVDALPHSSG